MSMTIKQLKQVIPYYFKIKLTPFVHGKKGVGKTEAIGQIAKAMGCHLLDVRLGLFEVADLLGIPRVNNIEELFTGLSQFLKMYKTCPTIQDIDKHLPEYLKKIGVHRKCITEYAMPEWLQIAMQGNCVIFWDEINRAKTDVIQAVFQAVLDRRIHLFPFPDTTYQACASNPDTEGYTVTDTSDEAWLSRFGHIALVPSCEEWINHAIANKFHYSVIQYVKDSRTDKPNFGDHFCSLPNGLGPNPRGFKFVSDLAYLADPQAKEVDRNFRGENLPILSGDLFKEMVSGIIGITSSAAYFESQRAEEKPVTAESIYNDYASVREKIQAQVSNFTNKKDLLSLTLQTVIASLNEKPLDMKDSKRENLLAFLNDLPNELFFAGFRRIGMLENIGYGWVKFIDDNEFLNNKIHKLSGVLTAEEKEKVNALINPPQENKQEEDPSLTPSDADTNNGEDAETTVKEEEKCGNEEQGD